MPIVPFKTVSRLAGITVFLAVLNSTAAMADRRDIDQRSSSVSNTVTSAEIERLPTKDVRHLLGLVPGVASPTGGLSDVASTGFEVGVEGQYQVSSKWAIGLEGVYSFFGSKDEEDNVGELDIVGYRFVPSVKFYPTHNDATRSPKWFQGLAIVAGGGLYNITDKWKFENVEYIESQTSFGANFGVEYGFPLTDKIRLVTTGSYHHAFTGDDNNDEDGGHGWFDLTLNVDYQLIPNWADQVDHRNQAWNGRPLIIGVSSNCGYPTGDFAEYANPGMGFGGQVLLPVSDPVNVFAGGDYMPYGVKQKSDDWDQSIAALRFEGGIQYDHRFPTDSYLDTYWQGSLVHWRYKEEWTQNDEKFEYKEDGFTFNLGAGVKRPLSNKIGLDLSVSYPVVGFGFEDDPPRSWDIRMSVQYFTGTVKF